MWLSDKVTQWLQISLDTVNDLRTENAVLKAERDIFKAELTKEKLVGDWLRLQVNAIQYERNALVERVYNIRVPVPEIVRTTIRPETLVNDLNFEDIGDEAAKVLGLPVYNLPDSVRYNE